MFLFNQSKTIEKHKNIKLIHRLSGIFSMYFDCPLDKPLFFSGHLYFNIEIKRFYNQNLFILSFQFLI